MASMAPLCRQRSVEALEAARTRRQQLLKDIEWLNAEQIYQQRAAAVPNALGLNNKDNRLRNQGELLRVWDGREYLHPVFQFDPETGRVMPEMKELIQFLPKDWGGWRQVFWLFQPHALLDGKCPADLFPTDPHAVIEAARATFASAGANW
jgi:hypothetical protein